MIKFVQTLALGGLAAALSTSALAEPEKAEKKKAPDLAARFAKLDSNADGFLDAEELKAGFKKKPEMAEKMLKRKDKDADGKLSKEEFVAKPAKKKADAEPGKSPKPGKGKAGKTDATTDKAE